MASEDSQSTSRALLNDDSPRPNNHIMNQPSTPPSSTETKTKNDRRTLRSSLSNVSLLRYRSHFRRNEMNTTSVNSHYTPSPSFPLFRRFYLMRSSLTRRRKRDLSVKLNDVDILGASGKVDSSPRIKTTHILTTICITLASACLLISMIALDLAYLADAIPNPTSQEIATFQTKNSTALCFRHPKVCVMKILVIAVFIVITLTLCYTILTLYTRARRHSRLLERKTDELEKEKCLTERLLHEILPPCVAKDLINGRKAPAEYYESVTVYFSDIVGFTIIASMCSPNETCDMLNRLYSIFDSLLENFDVYKVETIGDAYMVVSGAPNKNGDKHPNEIANMSLALLDGKQQVRVPRTSAQLQLRIGIHTGPVCAAVIGSKMPRYCMFGDTVNVANRMESSGQPERIHLSDDTHKRLINVEQYIFEDRGEIAVKGKGYMRTYFLLKKAPPEIVSKSRSNTISRKERDSI